MSGAGTSFTTWTADEIANYRGPVFRATVHAGQMSSDLEEPTMVVLGGTVCKTLEAYRAQGLFPQVTYGPHTEGERDISDKAREQFEAFQDPANAKEERKADSAAAQRRRKFSKRVDGQGNPVGRRSPKKKGKR